jgi:enamine deaminase RidA (YjgF/YER057c/UK114 family)
MHAWCASLGCILPTPHPPHHTPLSLPFLPPPPPPWQVVPAEGAADPGWLWTQDGAVMVVSVPALPRDAHIEVEAVALTDLAACKSTLHRHAATLGTGPGPVTHVMATYVPDALVFGSGVVALGGRAGDPEPPAARFQSHEVLSAIGAALATALQHLMGLAGLTAETVVHVRVFSGLPGTAVVAVVVVVLGGAGAVGMAWPLHPRRMCGAGLCVQEHAHLVAAQLRLFAMATPVASVHYCWSA